MHAQPSSDPREALAAFEALALAFDSEDDGPFTLVSCVWNLLVHGPRPSRRRPVSRSPALTFGKLGDRLAQHDLVDHDLVLAGALAAR